MISLGASKRVLIALASQKDGNEILSQLNNAGWAIPAAIVAAHVSATTDFAALLPNDLLVHIPAAAGNAAFEKIVTAGTKPSAAIVGDLYIALRSAANAIPSTVKL